MSKSTTINEKNYLQTKPLHQNYNILGGISKSKDPQLPVRINHVFYEEITFQDKSQLL